MINKEELLKKFEQAIDKAIELEDSEELKLIKKANEIENEKEREKYLKSINDKIDKLVPFDDPIASLAMFIAISSGNLLNKIK